MYSNLPRNASKYSKLYEDEWGIDWNGVIEIKSEGLENILKELMR